MVKTTKGLVRKETTGDGRESTKNWVERETGRREQTKTKKKRQKKLEKKTDDLVMNS
ncbi:MAG: hypothetical protein ABH849_03395 [Nanoarchaeota archaeon]